MAATIETLRDDLVELRDALDAYPGDDLAVDELLVEIDRFISDRPSRGEIDADTAERMHTKARQVVDALAAIATPDDPTTVAGA
jgi:hypothetical protein